MNIVVAVPVDENLASFIGKKGSANSITFYNRKMGSDVIVVLFPNQDEDKVYALAESLLLSSQIILSTANVDKKFGEALVAASLLGKRVLITNDNDVNAILRGSGIGNYEIVAKEELFDSLHSAQTNAEDLSSVRVDVDKAFPVRGIGTVALGIVTRGTIRQHDKLFHTSGKQVMVRSLQSQDEDVASASLGTRVGVSLKDIADDEIEKGDLLASQHVKASDRIKIKCRISGAAKEKISVDALYGLAANFSYVECIVKSLEGDVLELSLRSKLPLEIGEEVFLVRKEIPRIFAAGKVTETFD